MSDDTQELPVPDPIPGTIEPVTVVNQDEVKLYRARAVVLNLDSEVYDLTSTEIQCPAAVPVLDDSGARLGFASLFFDNDGGPDRMLADITIDYASPERLLAETQSIKLYPRVMGTLTILNGAFIDLGQQLVVKTLAIKALVLTPRAPSDQRLLPFGAVL